MKMRTSQDLFDIMVYHTLQQGQQSLHENSGSDCAYRGIAEDGANVRCAVGFLIDDLRYYEGLEGQDARCPCVQDAVTKSLGVHHLTSKQIQVMLAVQSAHDGYSISDRVSSFTDHFKFECRRVAKDFNLEFGFDDPELVQAVEKKYLAHVASLATAL